MDEPHPNELYESVCRGLALCATTLSERCEAVDCTDLCSVEPQTTYSPLHNTSVTRATAPVGRAKGIDATTKEGGKIKLITRCGVVLAASRIQIPNILRSSGVRSWAFGENFMANHGVGLGLRFNVEVCLHRGAKQGMETIIFR